LSKLEDHGDPGKFLGCQEGQDGFNVLNPDGSISVSRSVDLTEFVANSENDGEMEEQELSVLSEKESPASNVTRRGPQRTARRQGPFLFHVSAFDLLLSLCSPWHSGKTSPLLRFWNTDSKCRSSRLEELFHLFHKTIKGGDVDGYRLFEGIEADSRYPSTSAKYFISSLLLSIILGRNNP
jgi:hypothetical protein